MGAWNKGKTFPHLQSELRAKVCALYLEGKSYKQIAKIVGRNHGLVGKWIRQAGIGSGLRTIDAWNPSKHIANAYRAELKILRRFDSSRHWLDHRTKIGQLSPEYRAERARQAAKRRYDRLKNDADFKASRKAYLADWTSKNYERSKAIKRKSLRAWQQRPENRAAMAQRRRFKDIMGMKNQLRTVDMIGCSVRFLRQWLESKFKRGMSWDNYGVYWCIDHVIPCAKFDLSKKDEVKKCFHYTNLQPLTNPENAAKCDRVKPTQPELCMAI